MAVPETARMPRLLGVLAWALRTLGLLGLGAVTWLDRLVRQAGRADLAVGTAGETLAGATGMATARQHR